MDEDDREGEDGAARAFAQLGREVSLLRAAVEGLTAARENIEIPDYEPTLERTEKILVALAQRIDPIAKSPLLTMTPDLWRARSRRRRSVRAARTRDLSPKRARGWTRPRARSATGSHRRGAATSKIAAYM
jgi:hypothetical protein